ncbi:SGNH/GDSL hydrolase family protein [Paenibacillus thermotolerans]|nr:SGNH/GDSL hydrolase family protein [Paenibacillus sp. YIM B05601]
MLAYGLSGFMAKEQQFIAPTDAAWLYTNGVWESVEREGLGIVMAGKHTGAKAKIETDSPVATLKQRGTGGEIKVFVDGKPVVTHVVPKDDQWHELPIYRNLTGWHEIGFAFSALNQEIGGLYIEDGAGVRKPKYDKKRLVVIGHSYAEGCCLDDKGFSSFASLMGDILDAESINVGIGRTDINAGGARSGLSRVESDVIAFQPDYVLSVYGVNAVGSINSGDSSHEQYQAEYAEFLKKINDALPETQVFASGIIAVRGMSDETLAPFNEDIKNACASVPNCTFVDLAGKWNEENFAKYLSRDGIHPSRDGHEFLANEYAIAIKLRQQQQGK